MIKKELIENLYFESKLSMFEISKQLDVSVGTVNWWMTKHGIPKKNRSQANYEKYNKNGDPFSISEIDSIEKAMLYGLGVGIFWGEGNKVNNTSLRVGNTDSGLIKIYLRFLREICGVHEAKIRFGLQIFNDSDPVKAKNFWMKELSSKDKQFMPTISIISPQGKGSYKRKNKYGVVTVYVNNIKLVDWMHVQLNKLSPGSSVVERIHGES